MKADINVARQMKGWVLDDSLFIIQVQTTNPNTSIHRIYVYRSLFLPLKRPNNSSPTDEASSIRCQYSHFFLGNVNVRANEKELDEKERPSEQ